MMLLKRKKKKKRFKEQAYAYAARVVPTAEGRASRIKQEAQAYSRQVVAKAQGEVAEFLALLPYYTAAPKVMAERMYLDTMQKVLTKSTKIIVDNKAGNVLYLPLDKLVNQGNQVTANSIKRKNNEENAANDDSTLMVSSRDLARPTYNQGRE